MGGSRAHRSSLHAHTAITDCTAGPRSIAQLLCRQMGELLRTLCQQLGITVWEQMQGCLLESITRNFDRDATEPSGQLPNVGSGGCSCCCYFFHWGSDLAAALAAPVPPPLAQATVAGQPSQKPNPQSKQTLVWARLSARPSARPPVRPPASCLTAEVEDSGGISGGGADFLSSLLQQSYRVEPPGSGDMRHGSEGWKCLETSFRVRIRGPGLRSGGGCPAAHLRCRSGFESGQVQGRAGLAWPGLSRLGWAVLAYTWACCGGCWAGLDWPPGWAWTG